MLFTSLGVTLWVHRLRRRDNGKERPRFGSVYWEQRPRATLAGQCVPCIPNQRMPKTSPPQGLHRPWNSRRWIRPTRGQYSHDTRRQEGPRPCTYASRSFTNPSNIQAELSLAASATQSETTTYYKTNQIGNAAQQQCHQQHACEQARLLTTSDMTQNRFPYSGM